MYKKAISNPQKCRLPLTKVQVRKLYLSGRSMDDIAREAKCSRQRVARWMEFWGIRRRSSGQAAHLKLKSTSKHGPNWRGGRYFIESLHTWFVYAPGHPRSKKHNGAVQEHFLIAEARIGRQLREKEHVHHLDTDRANNSPRNLCVVTSSQHRMLHSHLGHVGMRMLAAGITKPVLKFLDSNVETLVVAIYIRRLPCVSDLEVR